MNLIQILQLLSVVIPLIIELVEKLKKDKKSPAKVIADAKKICINATNPVEALFDLSIHIPGFAKAFEKKHVTVHGVKPAFLVHYG